MRSYITQVNAAHNKDLAADDDPRGPVTIPESLRTKADDRPSLDPLSRVERSGGIVEGRDFADVCPQPTIPHPLDDLTQFRAIGLEDEITRWALGRREPAPAPLPDIAALYLIDPLHNIIKRSAYSRSRLFFAVTEGNHDRDGKVSVLQQPFLVQQLIHCLNVKTFDRT